MHTTGDFILHGGNADFANRQKLLFDKLSDAEQECSKNKMVTESTNIDVDIIKPNQFQISRKDQNYRIEMKRFRGKESIFKQPEGPAPRAVNRSVPDFHKNPHKWKKYTLDDVSNEDMTEESNTRAALSFLKELKARKSIEKLRESEKMDIDESDLTKGNEMKILFNSKKRKIPIEIEFKKPESNTTKASNISIIENDDKPVFRSSKIIMPEYVVGQKKKKKDKKERQPVKVDRSRQLKLDHLEELEEEEN